MGGSQTFGLGYFPIFPDYGSTNGSYGLFISPSTYDQVGIINTQGYFKGFSVGSTSIISNVFKGTQNSSILQQLGHYSLTISGSTSTDKYWRVIVDSTKFEIRRNIAGTNRTYNLLPADDYPSTGSGLKQSLVWTAGVVDFEYVKKDTTIYIDDEIGRAHG